MKKSSFSPGHIDIRWFEGGTLNVSANCLDRHLPHAADRSAILWESDDGKRTRSLTYRELHQAVCRFANILKAQGVGKGDVITLYMPMVPEAAVAMLACARIGAIHSVIFGGFSPESIAGRLLDSGSRMVITADEGHRAGKTIPLKQNVTDALKNPRLSQVERVIVFRHTGNAVVWEEERDRWWHTLIDLADDDCPPVEQQADR